MSPTEHLELDPKALAGFYAYPKSLTRPWVRANFISSVDGVTAVDGRSAGLGHPGDGHAYQAIRELADVIVVGAGTAVAENYGGAAAEPDRIARRRAAGLSEVPSLVITCLAVGKQRIADYRSAGAEVLVAGDTAVSFSWMLNEFAHRGWLHVVSEGGPRTFAAMVADDLIDELCLTISPLLVGGDGMGVVHKELPSRQRPLRLAGTRHHDDAVLLRYHTQRAIDRLGTESCE